MSQSDLQASFTKNIYRQIYSEVALDNPAITFNGKIITIAGGFKSTDRTIANAFEIANAMTVVL